MISCRVVKRDDQDLLDAARGLLLEYGEFLGRGHICLGGLEREIESLPGEYAAPGGTLFLVLAEDGAAAGCLALRTITTIDGNTTGELRRIWVRPTYRGLGAGQLLVECALRTAKEMRLKTMHLDTVPSQMAAAVKLYVRNGFVPCERYNTNLEDYARFFYRTL